MTPSERSCIDSLTITRHSKKVCSSSRLPSTTIIISWFRLKTLIWRLQCQRTSFKTQNEGLIYVRVTQGRYSQVDHANCRLSILHHIFYGVGMNRTSSENNDTLSVRALLRKSGIVAHSYNISSKLGTLDWTYGIFRYRRLSGLRTFDASWWI